MCILVGGSRARAQNYQVAQLNDTETESELDQETFDPDDQAKEPVPAPGPRFSEPEEHAHSTDFSPTSPSRPIFDWSKHKGEKEVPHPFADKGLIRIQEDGTYIYRTDESPQKNAFDFHIGLFDFQNLKNPETGATFRDNYNETSSPSLLVNYEWQFFHTPVGKLGLRAGGGLYVAQGHGHFVHADDPDLVGKMPLTTFTLFVVPISAGAVYRMQFWDKQLIVPYAEGGGTGFTFSELRDDGHGPKFGASPAAYFALGGALNMTYFDNFSRIQLDREYGINRVYLMLEYRNELALVKRFDFSSDFFNAGFLMEY